MKKPLIITLLIIAFVFRLFLTFQSKHGDMYNNWDWGQAAVTRGLPGFYDPPKEVWPHSRPNQPPGSIYLHAFSYWSATAVGQAAWFLNLKLPLFPSAFIWWWEIYGSLVTLKLPSLLADFVIAWVIWQFSRLWKSSHLGILVVFVYLFNPALWYNSAYWGQTDSIVAALSLLSLLTLAKKRLILSPIFLGLSLVTKASWAPMVPFYLYYWLRFYPRDWPKLVFTPLTALLLAFPFHPSVDLIPYLSNLYLSRILPGETAWITVTAFNFWHLFFPATYASLSTPILGLPATLVCWSLVAAVLLTVTLRSLKFHHFNFRHLVWMLVILFFAVFMFAPKMLQRYLYPVFPLLSLLLVFARSRLLWIIYGLMSACYLINLYYLWWSPGSLLLSSFYTLNFTRFIAIIYTSLFAALSYVYLKKTT